eukprot:15339876-Ditylum_brightwellii.AAC.1
MLERKFNTLRRSDERIDENSEDDDNADVSNEDSDNGNIGNSVRSTDSKDAIGDDQPQQIDDSHNDLRREPSEMSTLTTDTFCRLYSYESTSLRSDGSSLTFKHYPSHQNQQKQEPRDQKDDYDIYSSLILTNTGEKIDSTFQATAIYENYDNNKFKFWVKRWSKIFQYCRSDCMGEWGDIWDDIFDNDDINVVDKALLLCELPFTILRK